MINIRNITASTWILAVVSAFYAYGALVHVLNMLSLTGFEWSDAPSKWQALDVVYLLLDVAVCVGLVRRKQLSIYAFYLAGFSQVVLYTALRDWIMDVPEAYAITSAQDDYLTGLVVFHLITLTAVTFALSGKFKRPGALSR